MKECPYCGSTNLSKQGYKNGRRTWKCVQCTRKHTEGARLRRVPKQSVSKACLHCGKQTTNPKFCSQSCATTYSNLHHRERYEKTRKLRYCKHCGIKVEGRRTTCDNCNMHNVNWETKTVGEIADKASYQVHAHIRQRARYRYRKSDRPKYCVNCGYDKHIEICHIRAIADFPIETNVAEINDLKNLVALCPNCHWELDNDTLTIEEIRRKNDAID